MKLKKAVKRSEFKDVLGRFTGPGKYGLDTETFGLRWFDEHSLFSVQLSDDSGAYYFNFLDKVDHKNEKPEEEYILPREWLLEFNLAFQNPDSTWFVHNAKFDLGMLAKEGLHLSGIVHCTEAVARLIDPRHKSYRLSECMGRLAETTKRDDFLKSDAVMDYIKRNKLSTRVKVPGKDKPIDVPHFNLVPFGVLVPYGCQDTLACRELGLWQLEQIERLKGKSERIVNVLDCERKLTKTLMSMEISGMPLDVKYTQKGLDSCLKQIEDGHKNYKAYTGHEYVGSAGALFEHYFKKIGVDLPQTEDGNLSATKYVLQKILEETQDPVAAIVLDLRKAEKLANTYFTNYLHFVSSKDSAIHPSIRQGGTKTGRLSMMDPNLQNVPKPPELDEVDQESDSDLAQTVRRCFIPPKDECFFMPDYDQMEYRLMIDQAGEKRLIDAINGGLDVHIATAEMLSDSSRKVSRKEAKTINFMLLYGGGIDKLATSLKISPEEAKALRALYFERLPKVRAWIRQAQDRATLKFSRLGFATEGGYVVNWFGRWYPIDRGFEYKAANYLIQGGSADICKLAMVQIEEHIKSLKLKSKMRLQVHDELIFTVPESELEHCAEFVKIMETVYKPINGLSLTAGSSHSWVSWGDKVEGYPTGKGSLQRDKPVF